MRKAGKVLLIAIAFLILSAFCLAAYYFWATKKIPTDKPVTGIEVYKGRHALLVKTDDRVLARYPISLGRNPTGDKVCRGDMKTPEGAYVLDWKNPGSAFYKAFHIFYPNKEDKKVGAGVGCDPGGNIMIHGITNGFGPVGRFHRFLDWTQGCIAVTDQEMDQLWRTVPAGTPIVIYP